MGVCQSTDAQKQASLNKKIESNLRQDKALKRTTVKLLLLGPGECGKSTILKQMQIIHNKGFTEEELVTHLASIYRNVIDSMGAVLYFMKTEQIKFDNQELEVPSATILRLVDMDEEKRKPFSFETFTAVKKLWADSGVKQACERKAEFHLSDGAFYFFDNLDRIYQSNYKPSQDDILRIRVATSGVVQVSFTINRFDFRVFDVGGQKSERKKWIHVFDDVNSIIFILALSEYDKVLREDATVNRMEDAMALFAATINNEFFIEIMIILFLNKTDLFAEKILSIPIKTAYPNYDGPQTYADCLEYIRQQMLGLNQNINRQLRTHETCATDTNQVQVVINSCTEKIIEKMLQASGVS